MGEFAQQCQQYLYDRGVRLSQFSPGDTVLVLLLTSSSKLLTKWQGPSEWGMLTMRSPDQSGEGARRFLTSTTVHSQPLRLPEHKRQIVQRELGKMLKMGVIEESQPARSLHQPETDRVPQSGGGGVQQRCGPWLNCREGLCSELKGHCQGGWRDRCTLLN